MAARRAFQGALLFLRAEFSSVTFWDAADVQYRQWDREGRVLEVVGPTELESVTSTVSR